MHLVDALRLRQGGTGAVGPGAALAIEPAPTLFLGADQERQAVLFVKSATEGLNKVAHALAGTGTSVFTTQMEHHANLLPWRLWTSCLRYVETDDEGVTDEEALGRPAVEAYEAGLTRYALARLEGVPGLTLLGPRDKRIAILTFVLNRRGACAGGGIGARIRHRRARRAAVRAPRLRRLLCAARCNETQMAQGAVRASLGLYNTPADVDALAAALAQIARARSWSPIGSRQTAPMCPVASRRWTTPCCPGC